MASGSETMLAVPSAWSHPPYQLSETTQTEALGSRRRFFTLNAVSRLLTTARPSASTPTATGESWGRPSARNVERTARWFSRRNWRASSRFMLT